MTADLRVALLLGRRMTDSEGRDLGRVHDVRLRRDGPIIPGFGPALRIEGLLVGPESIASRLGLDRADITGPWPLDVWGKRAAHRARFVPWETIVVDAEPLRTTLSVTELQSAFA
ncbi:MAG TPA: PRC-barrel domain containing protein [Acidimicrobiia bacterium]|jgi:hypothetical protein|nr:PRC-barrel domain containing protein [Acidimicrobiia bacterium]